MGRTDGVCLHRQVTRYRFLLLFVAPAGKRMSLDDWCECPDCHMPCSTQPFLTILAAEGKCPMCCSSVDMTAVQQLPDPLNSKAGRP